MTAREFFNKALAALGSFFFVTRERELVITERKNRYGIA